MHAGNKMNCRKCNNASIKLVGNQYGSRYCNKYKSYIIQHRKIKIIEPCLQCDNDDNKYFKKR